MPNKFDFPLIPLHSASDLPSTLTTLRSKQPVAHHMMSSESLLRYMANGPPLSEHLTNRLREVGVSVSAIAALADTEQGRTRIKGLLGEPEASRVLQSLETEHLV